ncbi:MAG: GNAT family N-acetyltransferase [Rhizobiales bacterium]|nr:GNAT family N-acetyltransferase [Hyphomicrobiales bacterium]
MGTKVEIKGVQTPGLVIRDMVAPDARSLARYMLRDEYQATIAVRYETAADVQKFVARCLRRQAALTRSVFHLSAELKASSEVVGDGFIIMNRPKTFEIGWGVHPELWGRGFGTELGHALMAIAFEKLGATTVWAKSFASNVASLRVCDKLGMTEDRVSKNHPVAPGFRTDVSFRSISADDYFDAPY